MSAFIADQVAIHEIITWAIRAPFSIRVPDIDGAPYLIDIRGLDPNAIGQQLLNKLTIASNYSTGERVLPPAYRFIAIAVASERRNVRDRNTMPLHILKAIHMLRHETPHPGWDASWSSRFLACLVGAAYGALNDGPTPWSQKSAQTDEDPEDGDPLMGWDDTDD